MNKRAFLENLTPEQRGALIGSMVGAGGMGLAGAMGSKKNKLRNSLLAALAGGAGMNERVDHPTQKPLALCDKLLRSCKQRDGYVLVPFAGSGSECLAAKNIGLPFIGIELNADYVKLINKRLTTDKPLPSQEVS
jgi:DNA modification methylase